jgi:hypothetical protein
VPHAGGSQRRDDGGEEDEQEQGPAHAHRDASLYPHRGDADEHHEVRYQAVRRQSDRVLRRVIEVIGRPATAVWRLARAND